MCTYIVNPKSRIIHFLTNKISLKMFNIFVYFNLFQQTCLKIFDSYTTERSDKKKCISNIIVYYGDF